VSRQWPAIINVLHSLVLWDDLWTRAVRLATDHGGYIRGWILRMRIGVRTISWMQSDEAPEILQESFRQSLTTLEFGTSVPTTAMLDFGFDIINN